MEEKSLLKLKNIKKDYVTGPSVVNALKGIDLEFRESEFVAILGPSGCGKTTLLNIIGGLDRYTSGDLIINGKSTKTFKDRDWDTYRNHSIGFVFQSYNLIPHQTVLSNVELALTLSGVSKAERRRRATDALNKVGLGDQLHKKPSQMSGGQMQRVAIARALVNDPDILLADEPTGALDTTTSVQIMEILKEISKDKLIIMVTHNPELADTYATRIIKAVDGLIIDDSDPYTATKEEVAKAVAQRKAAEEKKTKNKKKTSMSFFTALSLSLNNLATKKGRTAMTSFAGSIGIIGIALILALSSGINAFIVQVQEDTLSTYPLTIQKETQDMSAMLGAMTSVSDTGDYRDSNQIYIDNSMGTMLSAMNSTVKNDLVSFKDYVDSNFSDIKNYVTDVKYTYDYNFQIYNIVPLLDEDGNVVIDENGNEKTEARKVGMETIFEHMGDEFSSLTELMNMGGGNAGINIFQEMIDNEQLLDQQYELIHGDWPEQPNEVVLVVSQNNQLSRMTLYMLGILDPDNIEAELKDVLNLNQNTPTLPGITEDESSSDSESESESTETESDTDTDTDTETELYNEGPFDYSYFTGMTFMILTNSDFYVIDENKTYKLTDENGEAILDENGNEIYYPIWNDIRENQLESIDDYIAANGTELKISGIIRPRPDATSTSISGAIGYTHELTELMLKETSESDVIIQQKETPNNNVITGLPFTRTPYTPETIHELIDKIPPATMEIFYAYMTEQILKNEEFSDMINVSDSQSFMGVFMLLPKESQAIIFDKILTAALANNPIDPNNPSDQMNPINTICQLVTSMNGGDIQVTHKNFVKLLPVLQPTSPLLAINGIAGLTNIVGAEDMALIDKAFRDAHTDLTLPENLTGLSLAMALSATPDLKAEYLGMIVDKALEKNKTGVDTLCGIVSGTAGEMITSDNLKEKLPTMSMAGLYSSFTGIEGLASLAGDEAMKKIYADTHDILMTLSVNEEMFLMILGSMKAEDETFKLLEETLYGMAPQIDETYESILKKLDNQEIASPASINFYAKDFESKEKIEAFIKEYNNNADKEYEEFVAEYEKEHDGKKPEGVTSKAVQYSDLVGSLMSSVTTIVNVISYVLIAFVAISLVVSSIMIGIITNISVLERTKEIGILRAIGASKKDVSRVFNAETVIIGFCAGLLGVVVTMILCIPASFIVQAITGFNNITAFVPLPAAIILVVISVLLTMIAGIIPARSAAKKDPVIALRSE